MKLLITDSATLSANGDLSTDIFKAFGETAVYENIDREALLKELADTDIILCNKTVIDKEIIKAADSLKYIGLFATGYNNIDIDAATERGITVCNAGDYSTNAVAQQVMAYILMHYTKAHIYNSFVHGGGWIKSEVFSPLVFSGDEVYGKTLGIVGYGNIGKAVKKAAEGLGMRVIVNTRTVKPNRDVRFTDFDTLLAESDIVTLHCPLNKETENIMNHSAFEKMRNGAFFINTSRGGTVDEQALFEALQSGKLSGAAVDVLNREPMSEDCILQRAENLIITPHTAWAPLSARKRLLKIVYDNITAFLNGKPQNQVNR